MGANPLKSKKRSATSLPPSLPLYLDEDLDHKSVTQRRGFLSLSVASGVLHLDGINDYVQFASHIVPTSGSYTVALFAFESAPNPNYIELISQGFSGGPGFYIGHDPSGIIRVSDSWLNTGVPFPADGQLHHFAVTVDAIAGNSKLYIDGALRATLPTAISTTSGGNNTRFGHQFDPFGEFFNGGLDEVRIYDRALTAQEVAALASGAQAVPEPTTMLLLGTGLAGVAAKMRKRRKTIERTEA